MCSPVGLYNILSVPSLRKGILFNVEIKTELLQTGEAQCDVYVLPPQKFGNRSRCALLLLTAVYGFISTNSKCQVIIDSILTDSGLIQSPLLPQLLVLMRGVLLVAVFARVVDDLVLAGACSTTDSITHRI